LLAGLVPQFAIRFELHLVEELVGGALVGKVRMPSLARAAAPGSRLRSE
jgi:hypothetical protein